MRFAPSLSPGNSMHASTEPSVLAPRFRKSEKDEATKTALILVFAFNPLFYITYIYSYL